MSVISNNKRKSTGRKASTNVRMGKVALSVGNPNLPTPSGWRWVRLLEVADLATGHTPSRRHPEYWNGGILWMNAGDARIFDGKIITKTKETINELGLENSAAELLPIDTVCLSRTGASIGYVVILGKPMATNQGFVNYICGEHLLPKYLLYLFLFERDSIISYGEGTAYKTVYFPEAKGFYILSPSLNEQKRIVTKIEESFSLVDSAKENLGTTKILLKQYRRSILKQAFEGKLTCQDPNDEPAKFMVEKIKNEKSNFQESETLFDIPDNWMWVRIDNICSKINDGTHFSPHNDSHGEIPYVTAKNIRPNKIDMSNITYISKNIHDEIYSRCNPMKGDILYTKDGTIGYSAVNEFDFEFSLLSSVSLIKPIKNLVDPYFLSHYLNSPANYYRITGKITGTALRRIILQRIKEIPIPLPPLNEQKRIVTKIEESFSIIEKNEKLVDTLLSQFNQIKNSILKQAFEGKLVSQDPNDESAEILLERIKQEKKHGK